VSKFIVEAPTTLVALLVRLVQPSPEHGVVFDSSAVLERFFVEIAALEQATAAALSDTELAAIWQRGSRAIGAR
jgi:hypothetical protein